MRGRALIPTVFTYPFDNGQPGPEHYVYAWFRGDLCLYVGCSKNPLKRITIGHHVIGKASKLVSGDQFHVWKLADIKTARAYELRQIKRLRPFFNDQRQKQPGLFSESFVKRLEFLRKHHNLGSHGAVITLAVKTLHQSILDKNYSTAGNQEG